MHVGIIISAASSLCVIYDSSLCPLDGAVDLPYDHRDTILTIQLKCTVHCVILRMH